jgi:hypothetical protein
VWVTWNALRVEKEVKRPARRGFLQRKDSDMENEQELSAEVGGTIYVDDYNGTEVAVEGATHPEKADAMQDVSFDKDDPHEWFLK